VIVAIAGAAYFVMNKKPAVATAVQPEVKEEKVELTEEQKR
jgi:hypothetical protein